jgi:hypothetical protein
MVISLEIRTQVARGSINWHLRRRKLTRAGIIASLDLNFGLLYAAVAPPAVRDWCVQHANHPKESEGERATGRRRRKSGRLFVGHRRHAGCIRMAWQALSLSLARRGLRHRRHYHSVPLSRAPLDCGSRDEKPDEISCREISHSPPPLTWDFSSRWHTHAAPLLSPKRALELISRSRGEPGTFSH